MIDDAKIDAAARWLVDQKGDGHALIAAALRDLGVMGIEISRVYSLEVIAHIHVGPPVPAVFDPNLDLSSMSVERRYLGECGEVAVGGFRASKRAYEDGVARYGSNPPFHLQEEVVRFVTRRTVELWRERLQDLTTQKHSPANKEAQ